MEVLEERMEALDRGENQSYAFLGCEQSDKINVEKVMSRVNGKESKAIGRTTEELDKGGK